MSYRIDTASNCSDLMDRLDAFLTVGHSLKPVYVGTGTGRMTLQIGTASSVQETITVTFSSATAFSVVGSVTGSLGSGTVGTAFTSSVIHFTIVAGGAAFVSADTITVVMTPPWTQNRGVSGDQYIWTAPGNDGASAIIVGIKRFFDVGADYDNLKLGGFTGYESASTFDDQPGQMTNTAPTFSPVLPLWNSSIPYWFIADGRRVIVIAKITTQFESMYLGYLDQYASESQFPYPLVVGGSMAWTSAEPATGSANWRFSYSGREHSAFPLPSWANGFFVTYYAGQLRLRRPDGVWVGFLIDNYFTTNTGGGVWPYSNANGTQYMTDLRDNLDGSYPTFPIVLTEDLNGVQNVYGELNGVRATTGHNNAAENTILDGRDLWLVVQNITRTTKHDYFCVRLD
jgi:hypothetical protein